MVNLSITASYLVAAVLILRLVLRRAPRWMFCLLWGLVALRLVCPISVESALSLIPSAEPLPREILYTAAPERTGGVTEGIGDVGEAGGFVNLAPLDTAPAAPVENGESHTRIWSFVLSRVWAAGMAAMLFYGVICYFLVHRRVAEATRLRGNIWQSEAIDSPFVLGLFRPMIYVTYKMEERDLEYVLAHEQAHIRRGDHWWKPLGFALLAVYWFNPLLWAAYMVFCRDIETACDEKVIRSMGKEGRQAYSRALLHCGVRRRSIAACPLAFGEIGVKERIKAVMNYRKPAFWVILLAFAAIGVAAVCLLTNPVDPAGEEEDSPEKESQGETLEREEKPEEGYVSCRLTFPASDAGRTEYNQAIFDISPFTVDFVLREGWGVEELSASTESIYLPDFAWSCVGIYDEEGNCVGAVGYNIFEPSGGTEEERMSIYNQIALGNDYRFDVKDSYRRIKETDQGETARVDVYYSPVLEDASLAGVNVPESGEDGSGFGGEEKRNFGILSYDREKSVYVVFEFDSAYVSEEQADSIAESLSFEDSSDASGQSGEGAGTGQEGGNPASGRGEEDSNVGQGGESIAASGQPEETPDTSAAGEDWGELLWEEADLDRDGENESIYLQEVAEDMEYELNVVKADGTLLWSTWISPAHVGWNTILLIQENGGSDYLVEYHPTMFQGYGDYWWSQFFWLNGEFQELDAPSVEYTLLEATGEGGEGLPPEKYVRLKEFESLTNRMLENAVLLVTSEQGELVKGPRKATELAQLYPVNYYGDYPEGDPGELAFGERLQFTFSSGAGAWATGLTLRSDGSFEGEYVDDDMGDAGEGYSGTEYLCSFTGRFGEIRKMGEHAYLMRLEELVCEEEEGKEWIEGGTRYVASGPYGMEDGEEFLLYLPGVAADDLTDLCLSWWPGRFAVNSEGAPENLDCYILYNINTGQGFFTDEMEIL